MARTSLGIVLDEMREFGKDKVMNCLRTTLVDEMRKFGKEKTRWGNLAKTNLGIVLEQFYDEHFGLKWGWGQREREFRLGEVGWLTGGRVWIKWGCKGYLYPVMAQSSDHPIGERLKIAVFALRSFDPWGEVRDDGLSELLRFCG